MSPDRRGRGGSEARGLIFNLQRFSLHDGPGIRTTVFLKGCSLSCTWCHNPESQASEPEVMVSAERCIRCGACVEACASGVPRPGAGRSGEPVDLCTVCGACVEICPTTARRIVGREVDTEELVAELERDRVYFDQSGGGVTFSGGEPLHQLRFLRRALVACREAGLHTAVDTCGLAPCRDLLAVAELTDLVLFDVKLIDDGRHREVTGAGNTTILANLGALAATDTALWLRVPLVPGVTDDGENLDGIARLAASLPGVDRVCLLPYHRTGEGKRERLGRPAAGDAISAPAAAAVRRAAERFEAAGVRPRIGG